jgi:hypothetical protein
MTHRMTVALLIILVASSAAAKKYVFNAVAVSGGVKASDYAVYNEVQLSGCAIGREGCNGNPAVWKIYCRSNCYVLNAGAEATVEPKTVKVSSGAETQATVCGRFVGPDAPPVCFLGIVSEFEKSKPQ